MCCNKYDSVVPFIEASKPYNNAKNKPLYTSFKQLKVSNGNKNDKIIAYVAFV